jgi:hypothetical protein
VATLNLLAPFMKPFISALCLFYVCLCPIYCDFNSFLWRSVVFRKGTMLTALLVAGAMVGTAGGTKGR